MPAKHLCVDRVWERGEEESEEGVRKEGGSEEKGGIAGKGKSEGRREWWEGGTEGREDLALS